MKQNVKNLKIGCCGFAHGMKKYFTTFKVVEIQQTFYQLPKLETAEKWRNLAPDDFEFCIKAWQGVTHPSSSPTYKRFRGKLSKPENYGFFQQTEEVINAWRETERICFILKARYVLFQCPGSFKPTDENIENMISFFKTIKNPVFCFVWEPRGEKWNDEIVKEICKKCGLIHGVDPFNRPPVTRNIGYFRMHGSPPGEKMYYYDYNIEDLVKLLGFCESFSKVYCFFNNINMYQNALKFIEIISKH